MEAWHCQFTSSTPQELPSPPRYVLSCGALAPGRDAFTIAIHCLEPLKLQKA
jgi:hypothetical protein